MGTTGLVLGLLAGPVGSSWVPLGRAGLCLQCQPMAEGTECCGAAGLPMTPIAAITVIHHPFLISVETEQALGSTGSPPQHVRPGVCMRPGSRRMGWMLQKKKHWEPWLRRDVCWYCRVLD